MILKNTLGMVFKSFETGSGGSGNRISKRISSKKNSLKKGFTLVELIVVLVVLAILAAVAVPAMLGFVDYSNDKKAIAEAKESLAASETMLSDAFTEGLSILPIRVREQAHKTAGVGEDTAFIIWTTQSFYQADGTISTISSYTVDTALFKTEDGRYVYFDGNEWKVYNKTDNSEEIAALDGKAGNIIYVWPYEVANSKYANDTARSKDQYAYNVDDSEKPEDYTPPKDEDEFVDDEDNNDSITDTEDGKEKAFYVSFVENDGVKIQGSKSGIRTIRYSKNGLESTLSWQATDDRYVLNSINWTSSDEVNAPTKTLKTLSDINDYLEYLYINKYKGNENITITANLDHDTISVPVSFDAYRDSSSSSSYLDVKVNNQSATTTIDMEYDRVDETIISAAISIPSEVEGAEPTTVDLTGNLGDLNGVVDVDSVNEEYVRFNGEWVPKYQDSYLDEDYESTTTDYDFTEINSVTTWVSNWVKENTDKNNDEGLSISQIESNGVSFEAAADVLKTLHVRGTLDEETGDYKKLVSFVNIKSDSDENYENSNNDATGNTDEANATGATDDSEVNDNTDNNADSNNPEVAGNGNAEDSESEGTGEKYEISADYSQNELTKEIYEVNEDGSKKTKVEFVSGQEGTSYSIFTSQEVEMVISNNLKIKYWYMFDCDKSGENLITPEYDKSRGNDCTEELLEHLYAPANKNFGELAEIDVTDMTTKFEVTAYGTYTTLRDKLLNLVDGKNPDLIKSIRYTTDKAPENVAKEVCLSTTTIPSTNDGKLQRKDNEYDVNYRDPLYPGYTVAYSVPTEGGYNIFILTEDDTKIKAEQSLKGWFHKYSNMEYNDILNYVDTAEVDDMSHIFDLCGELRFNNIDFSKINTSAVRDMESMFYGCKYLYSLNLHIDSATRITSLTRQCKNLTSATLVGNPDTNCPVANGSAETVFEGTSIVNLTLKDLNFSNFSNATGDNQNSGLHKIISTAHGAKNSQGNYTLTNVSFDNVTAPNIKSLFGLFKKSDINQSSLTTVDLSGLNLVNNESTRHMFYNCNRITSINLGSSENGGKVFNTSKVSNMSSMFNTCSSITSIDLRYISSARVSNTSWMFERCYSLTNLQFGNFNTSNVTTMEEMFNSCYSLTTLDIRSFNIRSCGNVKYMFHTEHKYNNSYNSNLSKIIVGSDFVPKDGNVEMFGTGLINLVGQNGTRFSDKKTSDSSNYYKARYACIDGVNGREGYLSDTSH